MINEDHAHIEAMMKDGGHYTDQAKASEPHTVRNTELQKNLTGIGFDEAFENCNFLKYCLSFREAFTDPSHELALQQRMIILLLPLPSAGIVGLHHNAWFKWCWRSNSGLCKY